MAKGGTRRAPADGYDFGNKRHYRRSVWKQVAYMFNGQVAQRQCMLMPSSEGDEIDVALAKGFREYNLHVVDENAAIVAHLKRRYPRIHTYAGDLSAIGQRMVRSGVQLDVANLDLTGYLSTRYRETVREFVWSGAMRPFSLVALTALKGRERPETTAHLRYLIDLRRPIAEAEGRSESERERADYSRVVAMGNLLTTPRRDRDVQTEALASDDDLCERWADVVRWGQYRSTVPMIWGLFALIPRTPMGILVAPGLPEPDHNLQLTAWQWVSRICWKKYVTGQPIPVPLLLNHEVLASLGSPWRRNKHA